MNPNIILAKQRIQDAYVALGEANQIVIDLSDGSTHNAAAHEALIKLSTAISSFQNKYSEAISTLRDAGIVCP